MPKRTTTLELWEGGDVQSRNIGPAGGEHRLGRIDGPGFYLFVARNAGGKSQHLALIARLQDERLMRADAPITDGELSAYLQIAEARVTFRRSAGGDAREPTREGLETLPEIELLPAPIDELITGAHLQGEDARARRRLRALLSYAPVESTPEIVDALCQCLEERAFAGELDDWRERAWMDLIGDVRLRQKRFTAMGPETAAEIKAAVLEQPREGVLDDHEFLMTRLNTLGNAAEKLAARQGEIAAGAEGRTEFVVASAARAAGVEADEAFIDRLGETAAKDTARTAYQEARDRAAELRVQRRSLLEEEERRDGLRGSHGERPDAETERKALTAARTRLARANTEERAARSLLDGKRAEWVAADSEALRLHNRARDAFAVLRGASAAVAARCVTGAGVESFHVPRGDEIDGDLAELAHRVETFRARLAEARLAVSALGARGAAVDTAKEKLNGAAAEREAARAALADAESAVNRIDERIAAWERTAELLGKPVEGPTAAEVASAERAATEAEAVLRLAEFGNAYRAAVAEHDQQVALLEWFELMAADYRAAKDESWNALGRVVTEELALPWLSVDGLRIKLHYDRATGALRTDPEAEAEERDLDDQDRISAGELHEAMLRLMLTRRERLGGILILPWQVVAALDEQRLTRLAGEVEAARLVLLSERPRRRGDPDELRLERVEAAP